MRLRLKVKGINLLKKFPPFTGELVEDKISGRMRRHETKLLLLFIFLIIVAGGFIIESILSTSENGMINPVLPPTLTSPPKISETSITVVPGKNLKETINDTLAGLKGDYAVAIENLKTGESFYLNEHKIFTSASLYKLWVMAETFHQIEDGKLTESTVMSQDINVLNDKFNISSESAEVTGGRITMTVSQALEKMITLSDNYAALLLSERVKLSNVSTFLSNHGFEESKLGTGTSLPVTTAWDTALFFEKLYRGELGSSGDSEKMLELLKEQKLNSKLPKLLPDKTIIAHKTGELDTFSHDAGIVYTKDGDYVIAVLTESNLPQKTNEQIAILSRVVYDYFNKRKN